MERCPNCGTDVREGSKFCTTCGHRFADDGSAIPATPTDAVPGESGTEPDILADHAMAAWPAARTTTETPAPAGWSWQPAPAPPVPTGDSQLQGEAGAPPDDQSEGDPWSASSFGPTPEEPANLADTPEPFPSPDRSLDTQPAGDPIALVDRASQLLTELRQVIAGAPLTSERDLSGVVSELEVAVTPPGAMPPDQLGALRDALFAARERPRDLDTVVDLTSRLETLIALVIAYDRATAAIERTLDVLRATGENEAP